MADSYAVERTQTIAAAPQEVFAKVVDLREWDHWSPWAEMDPNMEKQYRGEPGSVGAGYHWVGNRKVGEGDMTITDVDPVDATDADGRVVIDLRFIKPFKSESVTEVVVAPAGDGTQVTWRMTGQHTRMSKIMGIFKSMDKMVGPDFEKGLAKLKRISEGS